MMFPDMFTEYLVYVVAHSIKLFALDLVTGVRKKLTVLESLGKVKS